MNKYLLALLFVAANAFSQINPADSTVQVVGYWDKNETYTYGVTHKKLNVKGVDTTTTYKVEYKVDITVKDSTATSYTVEWKYRDYKAEQENIDAKIEGILNGMTVVFKTNELGEYQELLNLNEIKKHQDNAIKALEKELKLPEYFTTLLKSRSTAQNVESTLLKDIMQFYAFYGHAMGLGEEISDTVEEENSYGMVIKSDVYLVLEEIDMEDEAYLLKFFQTYDDASVGQAMGDIIKEFVGPEMKENITASGMEDYYGTYFHNSGWPFSSYFQRDMIINGETAIESRSIDLE
jgi:hypothetical protein